MSVIYIVDHNEVIYDVIKTRTIVPKKSPRYNKYLDLELLKNEKKDKKPCGTMGPAEYPPPNPSNFLRKQPKKYLRKGKPEHFERHCLKGDKKASLPMIKGEKIKKQDKQDEKNFIKQNVQIIKKSKPREPEAKFVDTRIGTVHRVENSGLEPRHVKSKGFGKPPYYLIDRVQQTKRLVQIANDKDELLTLPKCRYITRQERQKLLDGLKINWEQMQKEYQLLPIITDTIPKILRKTKMEKELKDLEKDIVLIEKHPYIYVLDEE